MEEIHNIYCHFDWYANFIIAFVEDRLNVTPTAGITIVDAFIWDDSRQGISYWSCVSLQLRVNGIFFTEEQIPTFTAEARNFYTPLYEELKLNHPELFI